MTDVVPHADTSPGDGRRRSGGPRGHRAHRGLRVPGSAPTPTGGLPVAPSGDGDARARHRRAPGTSPIAVPTTGGSGSSRHRAAHPREAFDPATGPITASGSASGPAPSAAPRTRAGTTVRTGPDTGVTVALGTVGTAPEAGGTTPGAGGPSHAAPPRRGVPLRATIGILGAAGVATLFVMTSPDSPVPTSAPIDPLPAAAAAGLVGPDLPGAPAGAPAPLPVVPVAPPAVSTTPTTESAQPVIGALFDLTAGSLSDLFDNSGDEGLVEGGARPRAVANPDDPARQAWQFSLPGGGKRSEVLPQGPGTEPVDGDEQYVRYTAQLSDDFPTDTGSWQVILQWHHMSPDGSPPLALQVTRGQLYMVSNGDDMRAIGPVSPGQRIDLTMHVKFSQEPGEGAVTVWRDGQATGVTNWTPQAGTMSTHAAYLKMGLYRDTGIGQPGSVLVTDLKIGRDARGIGGIGPRPVT